MGVYLLLFAFTPYIIFNYKVKFPTIIVVQRALLKKMWIRSKRLKKIRIGRSEKTKNKKDRAFAKKSERGLQLYF
ncbi:hypothetical protein CWM47_37870 [Spirosoma pollinicola]|uniref:Uncharacterized protein n=1 Tax=Spirosoma pollinicola TaxID=2057025 RepID=A0A2K8ZB69_9BACT|nr:hypothetical protein CWM47_37870 [Spirosoma pollinicola]